MAVLADYEFLEILLVIELSPMPLTPENFAPFGEVIDLSTASTQSINFGLTTRFHDLLSVDTASEDGRTLINVFRSQPIKLPHRVEVMERHPLGSQAFIPMTASDFFILVGSGVETLDVDSLRLFFSDGSRGVNYHKNTWHHYQMVLDTEADFLVVDRGGPGNNLQEQPINEHIVIPESARNV
jgi:ureidoglycolate lyase